MVALQILVLPVQVRILVGQHFRFQTPVSPWMRGFIFILRLTYCVCGVKFLMVSCKLLP
jgi:hypothetical protein